MHLRFNFDACPVHSPFGFMHLMHQDLSARALFCLKFTRKSKYAVINLSLTVNNNLDHWIIWILVFVKCFLKQNYHMYLSSNFANKVRVMPRNLCTSQQRSSKVIWGQLWFFWVIYCPTARFTCCHLKVLATIPYFNFHFFPHLLIFLQFRDPSCVLSLSTKAVLQKWHN